MVLHETDQNPAPTDTPSCLPAGDSGTGADVARGTLCVRTLREAPRHQQLLRARQRGLLRGGLPQPLRPTLCLLQWAHRRCEFVPTSLGFIAITHIHLPRDLFKYTKAKSCPALTNCGLLQKKTTVGNNFRPTCTHTPALLPPPPPADTPCVCACVCVCARCTRVCTHVCVYACVCVYGCVRHGNCP